MPTDWQQVAQFFVAGEPKAQPRPRARVIRGCNPIAQIYNPSDADEWKRCVALYSSAHAPPEPIDGAVKLDVQFLLPRPKYLMAAKRPDGPVAHLARPDVDNLFKAVADSLTDCGWWRDDAQVCDCRVRKLYHGKAGQPGAWVRVSTLVTERAALFDGEAVAKC